MSDHFIERAQTAEAKLSTMQQNVDTMKAELQAMRETFGIRGSASAGYRIDYDKLIAGLGTEQCVELKALLP